jgi:uncharacterized protein
MAQQEISATELLNERALCESLAAALRVDSRQVAAAIRLLRDGNTVPFLARYRKELTGGLDEVALREIESGLEQAEALAARKATILKAIAEQEKLTDQLARQIRGCADAALLEAIYAPYKQQRRSRAETARRRGLQPLADLLLAQDRLPCDVPRLLAQYISEERELPDADAALAGALDIVAETWAADAEVRTTCFEKALRHGRIVSGIKRGQQDRAGEFAGYANFRQPVGRLASHRVLAILRGETEGVLRVSLEMDDERMLRWLERRCLRNQQFPLYDALREAVADCYRRLLLPAMRSHVLSRLKTSADAEAIEVFAKNLRELLMAPPAGPRVTIGIDPGFRTGCKLAVVDATGKLLEDATIYPTPPRSDVSGAAEVLGQLVERHVVRLIAIGNGTASRETDAFVRDWLRGVEGEIDCVTVSEAGASIYSASELAAREFPDLDVTVRGAISIARRLQDPLAELVKCDPKSIGVGQYQHDVHQGSLKKTLDRVVESCVSQVGVDVNTASAPLLSYVAGIGPKLAEQIIAYRERQGGIGSRGELLEVPRLGRKAFEQAAGFLRIRDGDRPLDNSAVHPESYHVVERMAGRLGIEERELVGNASLCGRLDPASFVDERCGLETARDILSELAKPGRDPRETFRTVRFDASIKELTDLRVGMVLPGVITNVTQFGAFVDLGVHQDGLIHISKLSREFVRDPHEVVRVGQPVQVEVLEVDVDRKRISLARR